MGKQQAAKVAKAAERKGREKVEKRARALQRLEVQYVPTDSIKPNRYNSNRQSAQDFELLVKSIQEDGFDQPVIVHTSSREIVDGEHRWRAARHLHMAEIPVVFSDMDEAQRRIATLRHNRARGAEELESTVALLRDLEQMGAADWAKDSLEMSDLEWTRLLEDIPATDLAAEEYAEAWEPERAEDTEINAAAAGQGIETAALPGGTAPREGAMTEQARETMRQRQDRINRARTAEEREAAAADLDVFRLTMVFSGQEAELVKRCLGHRPAQRLIEILRSMDGQLPVEPEPEVEAVPVPHVPTPQ